MVFTFLLTMQIISRATVTIMEYSFKPHECVWKFILDLQTIKILSLDFSTY